MRLCHWRKFKVRVSVQQDEFLHIVLEISPSSEPKMLYIASDIVQGNLKNQTQIEYLIDVVFHTMWSGI